MLLIESIPKILFCHYTNYHISEHLPYLHHNSSPDTYTVKINFILSPHLFSFYPSVVSGVNKINVLGIVKVAGKQPYPSVNMLYVSGILVKITHNL